MSKEIFWMSNLKVFNADFDSIFICWAISLLPFIGEFLYFEIKYKYLYVIAQY